MTEPPLAPDPEEQRPGWTSSRVALVVAIIAAGAFALRVYLTWDAVFGQEYVAFVETDAWYHMRLVDAVVRDFPWRIWYDPYLVHPGGEPVNAGPVLDWIIAATALVLGAGAPSPRLVDVVGAYVPPVLGALTVVPVYVLGREMFSRNAGIWAAVLVAAMPGQLLKRSLLGFTDHHCVEALLSTTAMMFVALALDDRRPGSRRLALALAGGVALGTYLLSWGGGVVVVAILVVWALMRLIADAWRGRSGDVVTLAVFPALTVAAAMVLPWASTRPHFSYQFASLVGGALAVASFRACHRTVRHLGWSVAPMALLIAGTLAVSAGVAYLLLGESAASLLGDASRVSPLRPGGFVSEAQPLMASELWRPVPLWKEFATGLLLALFGTGWLAREALARRRPRTTAFFALWTVTMVLATFGQVRFAYYLAVNVALLGGAACDRLIALTGDVRASTGRRKIATAVLGCLIVAPGVPFLVPIRSGGAALNVNWHDALLWLRANTPEPFSNPVEYYRPAPAGAASAGYGVLAWWDYGYWITRVARRVPVANPRQTGVREVAAFLLSSDESDANRVVERVGARYIGVDWQLQAKGALPAANMYFAGIAIAAGRDPSDYCGLFVEQAASTGAVAEPVVYCYPEYYRTMAMRLYLYGGRAGTPADPVVVLSVRRERRDGLVVQVIVREHSFSTYDEATRFVTNSGQTNLRIVSKHPHRTCVPLAALSSYAPVFRSLDREGVETSAPPVVQLFEYRPRATSRPGP